METPEEIKKIMANPRDYIFDLYTFMRTSLAYIQQLEDAVDNATQLMQSANELIKKRLKEMETRLAQAERERDAAVESLHGECFECVWHESMCDKCASCVYCADAWNVNVDNWKWRGVCP